MKLRFAAVLLVVSVLKCQPCFAQENGRRDAVSPAVSEYVPVHAFDPDRDAAADVERAIAEARRTGKRVLLDIGGDWCPWCHLLEQFFQGNPSLLSLREDNFVTVAIYSGAERKDKQILSRYPKVPAIPHFFVLEGDGSLLHSQNVVELQTKGTYSPDKMREFFTKWSLPRSNVSKPDPNTPK